MFKLFNKRYKNIKDYPVIYDKAKWHYEADSFVGKYDRHQGFVHGGVYLGWCIMKDLSY